MPICDQNFAWNDERIISLKKPLIRVGFRKSTLCLFLLDFKQPIKIRKILKITWMGDSYFELFKFINVFK